MWKDFFYFSKKERNGIIVLIVFLSGIFLGKTLFSRVENAAIVQELKADRDTFRMQESPASFPVSQSKRNPSSAVFSSRKKIRNNKSDSNRFQSRSQNRPVYPKSEKYASGIKVNINRIDTLDLKKIPGIGSAYARRIVKYRELLGGFYSVEQIREVYGMDDEQFQLVSQWMKVENDSLVQIPVNQASVARLKSHPYLNFYQAKAIVDIRKQKGRINDLQELSLLEEFSEEDLQRLQYYLSTD